jgi:hypothetical protein
MLKDRYHETGILTQANAVEPRRDGGSHQIFSGEEPL